MKINSIRNKRGNINTDLLDITEIIKEHCEQLYGHTFDNPDKVDLSLKDAVCRNSHKMKQTMCAGLYVLKKLNQ